jgi:ketosteroid isomerase-like protein
MVCRDMSDADRANRELVERFFAASERGDRDEVGTLIDDDMVMEWPQSGERFRGRDAVLAAMAAVEVKPQFAGEPRLVGSGPLWVLMVPLRYGDDVLHYVAVLELADGRIRRGTGYWGAPFPAQASRAAYLDRA